MHYGFLDGDNGTQSIQSKDLANALLSTLSTQELLDHVDISSLEEATLSPNDRLLVETSDGDKKLSMYSASYNMINTLSGIGKNYWKRSIWRGKDLGSYITDKQYAAIANGTFDDLFIGDYWWNGSPPVWRIVDIDYWLSKGSSAHICNDHHLVIIPDNSLYSGKMNDTNVTTGGYMGSKMFSSGLIEASNIINSVFGSDHVLQYEDMLTNAVDTNGVPSGSTWCYMTVCLPSTPMVFSSYVWEQMINNVQPSRYSVSNEQLAGMRLNPRLYISNRSSYWLREPANKSTFFQVSGTGHIGLVPSSSNEGVRPVFGIKG